MQKSTPEILVDAGPLLALVATFDTYHHICVSLARKTNQSYITTLAAFTEAMYLALDRYGNRAVEAMWAMIFDGLVMIEELNSSDYARSSELMHKYSDIPMDLADATLVAIAERLNIDTIFTIDRRDFSIYKLNGRKSFRILGP